MFAEISFLVKLLQKANTSLAFDEFGSIENVPKCLNFSKAYSLFKPYSTKITPFQELFIFIGAIEGNNFQLLFFPFRSETFFFEPP